MASKDFHSATGAGLPGLFDNALNSDFTVYCQDKQYKVHKAIICLQGGFFAKVTTAQFKEKDEHMVVVDSDDPQVIEAVLQSLYCIEYTVPSGRAAAPFHASVYSAADFYQLDALRNHARDNFIAITQSFNVDDIQQCLDAAVIVYNETPASAKALRNPLVTAVNRHYITLFHEKPNNKRLLAAAPDFAADLLCDRALAGHAGDPYIDRDFEIKLKCPHCLQVCLLHSGYEDMFLFGKISRLVCPICQTAERIEEYQRGFTGHETVLRHGSV